MPRVRGLEAIEVFDARLKLRLRPSSVGGSRPGLLQLLKSAIRELALSDPFGFVRNRLVDYASLVGTTVTLGSAGAMPLYHAADSSDLPVGPTVSKASDDGINTCGAGGQQ